MFYNTDQHKNPAQLDTLRALIELYLGPYCPEFCPGIVEHSDQVDPEIQLVLYQGTLEFAGLAQNTCSYTVELPLY